MQEFEIFFLENKHTDLKIMCEKETNFGSNVHIGSGYLKELYFFFILIKYVILHFLIWHGKQDQYTLRIQLKLYFAPILLGKAWIHFALTLSHHQESWHNLMLLIFYSIFAWQEREITEINYSPVTNVQGLTAKISIKHNYNHILLVYLTINLGKFCPLHNLKTDRKTWWWCK